MASYFYDQPLTQSGYRRCHLRQALANWQSGTYAARVRMYSSSAATRALPDRARRALGSTMSGNRITLRSERVVKASVEVRRAFLNSYPVKIVHAQIGGTCTYDNFHWLSL